jgi:hypothetical protein
MSQNSVGDDIDRSGAAIMSLIDQVIKTSRAECDRALETAHQYSLRLRAAEDLVNKLQTKVEQLEDQAFRAQSSLNRIQGAIEEIRHGQSILNWFAGKGADTDEAGYPFQFEAGQGSNVMSATGGRDESRKIQ